MVQLSRWDRIKCMTGVLHAFSRHVDPGLDAHLALVGPTVSGVSDDPEGGAVLDECLATRVGGIVDQIVDGTHGLLIDDPLDLESFGRAVSDLLADPSLATRFGERAYERAHEEFLGDRHLERYADLFAMLG